MIRVISERKHFFSGDVFPYSNGEFAKCDSAKAKAQPMKKIEMEVARSHCLHCLNSFRAERLFCLYII